MTDYEKNDCDELHECDLCGECDEDAIFNDGDRWLCEDREECDARTGTAPLSWD